MDRAGSLSRCHAQPHMRSQVYETILHSISVSHRHSSRTPQLPATTNRLHPPRTPSIAHRPRGTTRRPWSSVTARVSAFDHRTRRACAPPPQTPPRPPVISSTRAIHPTAQASSARPWPASRTCSDSCTSRQRVPIDHGGRRRPGQGPVRPA